MACHAFWPGRRNGRSGLQSCQPDFQSDQRPDPVQLFGGDSTRPDVNATFLQPFVAYVTPTKTTFSLNTESTYDWESKQWSVPVNLAATQLIKVGNQMVSVGGGVRYWAESPNGGPDDWGLRLVVTFLFPR